LACLNVCCISEVCLGWPVDLDRLETLLQLLPEPLREPERVGEKAAWNVVEAVGVVDPPELLEEPRPAQSTQDTCGCSPRGVAVGCDVAAVDGVELACLPQDYHVYEPEAEPHRQPAPKSPLQPGAQLKNLPVTENCTRRASLLQRSRGRVIARLNARRPRSGHRRLQGASATD